MAQNDPVVNRIRIIPRKDDFLDRNVGASGEIYYSSDVDTLRLYSGNDKGGFEVVTQNNIRRNTAFEEVASIKYTVTVDNQSDTANRYVLNGDYHTKVTMMRGYTYVFDQSDQTNVYYPNAEGTTINTHPLLFSTTADGSHATPIAGTPYETGVIYLIENLPVTRAQYISKFSSATSRKVQITVTVDTPDDLHYYCQYHSGMGNEITVSYPGTGTGGASITVSDTAPEEPTNGNLWYKSDDGRLLVYVTDTDSSQWVQPSVPIADTNSGVGNFQLSASTIDTDDSSGISIVPSVTMNSDLILSNPIVLPENSKAPRLVIQGDRGTGGSPIPLNYGTGRLIIGNPETDNLEISVGHDFDPGLFNQYNVTTISSTRSLNLLSTGDISIQNGSLQVRSVDDDSVGVRINKIGFSAFSPASLATTTTGLEFNDIAEIRAITTQASNGGANVSAGTTINLRGIGTNSGQSGKSGTFSMFIDGLAGNVGVNVEDAPDTNFYITTVNVYVNQGGTAYIVDTIEIEGVEQTIDWEGGSAPTGTNNGVDNFEFKLIRFNNTWIVIGKMTGHG